MNNFGYGGYGSYSFPSFTPNNFNSQNSGNLGYGFSPMPQIPNNQSSSAVSNTYAYVNGLEGAKAYLVQPNTTLMLMDSDNPVFYIKNANQQGQATLRQFKFEEVSEQSQSKSIHSIDLSGYVKREEFDEIKVKLDDVINSSKAKVVKTNG